MVTSSKHTYFVKHLILIFPIKRNAFLILYSCLALKIFNLKKSTKKVLVHEYNIYNKNTTEVEELFIRRYTYNLNTRSIKCYEWTAQKKKLIISLIRKVLHIFLYMMLLLPPEKSNHFIVNLTIIMQ